MFSSQKLTALKKIAFLTLSTALALSPLAVAHEHEQGKEDLSGGSEKTLTGEVVDLMCYLDHNAAGDKHSACASKCIKNGGPVGLATESKTYIIVGDHKPMNDELADLAGKTITVKGKVAERGGLAMIENAEIVKK